MIIVSDTTPFGYPIEIEVIDVLSTLFGRVLIPQAVASELQHQNTPQKIKEWIQTPPLKANNLSRCAENVPRDVRPRRVA